MKTEFNTEEALRKVRASIKSLKILEKSLMTVQDLDLFPSFEPKKETTSTLEAIKVIRYLSERLIIAGMIKIDLKPTYSRCQLVKARIKESSFHECCTMIDSQVYKWLNTDYQKYLRIETLFKASKFQGYVDSINEIPIHNKENSTIKIGEKRNIHS